jgi:hypothetical protein
VPTICIFSNLEEADRIVDMGKIERVGLGSDQGNQLISDEKVIN